MMTGVGGPFAAAADAAAAAELAGTKREVFADDDCGAGDGVADDWAIECRVELGVRGAVVVATTTVAFVKSL